MNQSEKNIKLAEWAGFKKMVSEDPEYVGEMNDVAPTGDIFDDGLPNFFLSMDACEKYLIPKLGEFYLESLTFNFESEAVYCSGELDGDSVSDFYSQERTMSSALCEAVGRAFKLWE